MGALSNTGHDLAAIRARTDAATPGPWLHGDLGGPEWSVWQSASDPEDWTVAHTELGADAEFIAAARTDVPALLDIIDQQAKRLALAERAADTNYQLYKAGCEIIADRDTTLQAVRNYAQERSYHAGNKNNAVSSWRIASDLLGILDSNAVAAEEAD